jgi:hypothetical protein
MSSGTYRFFEYDDNGNLTARAETDGGDEGWFYNWTQDDRLNQAFLVLDSKVGEYRGTTFAYDAGGRRLLRHDDDGTWTRYFYDGLNVLLPPSPRRLRRTSERESEIDPNTWGTFVGEDAEDGDAAEWWTWAGTTITNEWDSERRSLVIQTSDPDTDGTRAIVGDDSSANQPNDDPWNAARRVVTAALRRQETGNMRITVGGSPPRLQQHAHGIHPLCPCGSPLDTSHSQVNDAPIFLWKGGHVSPWTVS